MPTSSLKIPGAIMALAGAALASLAPSASAAELGFYVAGFYGQAKIPLGSQADFDASAADVYSIYRFVPLTTNSSLSDDKDSSFGMFAGYRLFANLAIEGGYIDVGEVSYRNDSFGQHFTTDPPQEEPWFQTQSASISGIALTALGVWPVSYRWELYARGGVLFATNEVEIFVTDFIGSDFFSGSDSSTDLLAGVGAAFSFAEVYAARFEVMRVFGAGEGRIDGDLDVASIGFSVSF